MENITTPIRGSNHVVGREGILSHPAGGPPIRFGTDGWRGRIAEDITFSNMRRCTAAIGAWLKKQGLAGSPVAVGFDGRFLSGRFAHEIARSLSREGFVPLLSPGPVPTPALSLRVVTARAPLGMMVTASHNPPEYGGLKIKGSYGGSPEPEEIEKIAKLVPPFDPGPGPEISLPPHPSFVPAYLNALKKRVTLRELRGSGLRVVVDSMHGTGGNLLERILTGGKACARTIRAYPDPLFGGTSPEPVARRLTLLAGAVRHDRAAVGFATDGDADRVAACDERGHFVSPLTILPLLALHLIESRGERGGIARTFAGSFRMERIARRHGLRFYELPVGFGHVAALLRRDAILLGGEESGGFGFRGFLPERDGILSALLLLEAMVFSGLSLSRLVVRMEREYGRYRYDRIDLACSPDAGRRKVERLSKSPPERIAGMRVTGINRLDGLKLLLGEDGWVLFRPSGTEPLLRLYCEAPTSRLVAAALRHATRLAQA